MDKVFVALAEKNAKRLQNFVEAAGDKSEEMEEEALCKAVQKLLKFSTSNLQQQNLARAVMGLCDGDVNELIQ